MSTKCEEKPMGQIAFEAYDQKQADGHLSPYVWDCVAGAVIAEYERREAKLKAGFDAARVRRCAEADIEAIAKEQADPNAECKAAFAAGKRIQYRFHDLTDSTFNEAPCPSWSANFVYRVHPDDVEPAWIEWNGGECPLKDDEVEAWEFKLRSGELATTSGLPSGYFWPDSGHRFNIIAYRVLKWKEKPWTLGRSVNGHTLADGQGWHRTDWTKDMLPDGYRPLYIGDTGSYEISDDGKEWRNGVDPDTKTEKSSHVWMRTTRPLPAPVDPFAEAKQWLAEGKLQFRWITSDAWRNWNEIYAVPPDLVKGGWTPEQFRRRPDLVIVPLGPDDVPPGSAFRWGDIQVGWVAPSYICTDGAWLPTASDDQFWTWTVLKEKAQINRNDGKGFVPCSKEVQP